MIKQFLNSYPNALKCEISWKMKIACLLAYITSIYSNQPISFISSIKAVIIDGRGHLVGRLASVVAKNLLEGGKIVVVRCEELALSGHFYRYVRNLHIFLYEYEMQPFLHASITETKSSI